MQLTVILDTAKDASPGHRGHGNHVGRDHVMLADLRARSARVCRCKCTGMSVQSARVAPLRKYSSFLSGTFSVQWCTPCTCTDIPAQPVRVNLPTWFLPTWFPFSRGQEPEGRAREGDLPVRQRVPRLVPARRLNRRLPDGVGTNGVFTEGPHFPTFCNVFV